MEHCVAHFQARRAFTYMGAFRHAMEKPSVLWGTLPTLKRLVRSRSDCRARTRVSSGTGNSGQMFYSRSDAGRVRGGPDVHARCVLHGWILHGFA